MNWAGLDDINLGDFFEERIPMMKSCPHFLRVKLKFSLSLSLSFALRDRSRRVGGTTRTWKLFGIPTKKFRVEWQARIGRWQALIENARRAACLVPTVVFKGEAPERDAAQDRIERGQISRARQELTGAALAPQTKLCKNSSGHGHKDTCRRFPFRSWVSHPSLVTLNAHVFATSPWSAE